MSKKISVGNRQVPLLELVSVACSDTKIELDPATFEKIEAQKPSGNATSAATDAFDVLAGLSTEVMRASVFVATVSAMQGRAGVPASLVTFLSAMLNSNGTVEKPGADVPNLSSEQVEYLRGALNPPLAMAALTAHATQALLSTADAVAALSCEAFEASMAPFDQENFNVCRQHRGLQNSAEVIRLMLANSKRVKVTTGKEKDVDPEAISTTPQYHGPLIDVLPVALKTIKVELNSAPANNRPSAQFCANPCASALATLVSCLEVIGKGSAGRTAAVESKGSPETKGAGDTSALAAGGFVVTAMDGAAVGSAATAAYALCTTVHKVLAKEAVAALAVIQAADAKAQVGAAAKAATKAPVKEFVKKEDASLKGMSAEKLAKIEAKRKAKEEKEAKKKAAKAAKSGGVAGGLVLGSGTKELREKLGPKSDVSAASLPPSLPLFLLSSFTILIYSLDPIHPTYTFLLFCRSLPSRR
jgi:hypothetical protein